MADGFAPLAALAFDLSEVAKQSGRKARQVIQQTGMRTKAQWRSDAAGNPFGRQYTATIDYTLDGSVTGGAVASLEVGPNLSRYGGKTGKGGLVPSAGIFDDPLSSGGIRVGPDRSRVKAEKFAVENMATGMEIAMDQLLKERGL